ncbi:MAG: CoA protein activase [Caldicoprobacterales bacterium]|jgi:predicted nucleotide-binding protein (sugar kinase/HSP70/actin superfamily)
MTITFPHMGQVYIPAKALFDDLGVPVVVPPPVSSKTLEIGTRISPEMACLPLKINLGNYIQSLEQGADTIVLTGSCGPCRFGYYGVVEQEILKDQGYQMDVVILDAPDQCGRRELLSRIRRISGKNSLHKILRAFIQASKVVDQTDKLLGIFLKKRPRELIKGETDRLQSRFEKEVLLCNGSKEMLRFIQSFQDKAARIPERANASPLHIGLVGEIYTLIEPYVNLNIERKLGSLGAEVYRGISVADWVKTHLSVDWKHKKERKAKLKKGAKYLDLCIGGHAWETVASTVHYVDAGLDGVIQVLPFGCMPEIVAESILPSISRDLNFPIMTLTMDELTGEAGYMTRLEAFVDLLLQKRGKDYEQA